MLSSKELIFQLIICLYKIRLKNEEHIETFSCALLVCNLLQRNNISLISEHVQLYKKEQVRV